ncbi:MAG: hypothetical protein ABSE69_09980 [Roseiarcus sp.]|jgi:hypothetical protein
MAKRFPAYGLLLGASLATGLGIGYAVGQQPHMQAAIGFLQSARAELGEALANKGGHRLAAIGLIDQAIDQVRQGIAAGGG